MPKHAKTVAKKKLEMKASSQKEISKAVNVPECCEMLLSREELEKETGKGTSTSNHNKKVYLYFSSVFSQVSVWPEQKWCPTIDRNVQRCHW